ncbi:MAG: oligosaccharide flippase family protein [Pseudomonadota bacterium]
MPGYSKKLAKNTFFNFIGKSYSAIIVIFLVPIIIKHIGMDHFGVWAIVSVIFGYVELADLGFGSSYLKYLSEAHTKNDIKEISKILVTGLFFYITLVFLVAIILIPSIPLLIRLFNLGNLKEISSFAILIGFFIFAVNSILGMSQSLIHALQRYDISNKVSIFIKSFRFILMVILLYLGYGLKGLMIGQLMVTIIHNLINFVIAKSLLPGWSIKIKNIEHNTAKKLFKFGIKIQTARISEQINAHIDKIILSNVYNITLVGYYEIATKIVNIIKLFAKILASATIPLASELEAKNQTDKIHDLFFTGTKLLVLTSSFMILFILMFSDDILFLWLGKIYDDARLFLHILIFGVAINITSAIAMHLANGMGKPEFEMNYGFLLMIMNLTLSILGIIFIGKIGPALGTTVSLSVATLYYLVLFCNYLKVSLKDYLALYSKPVLAIIIIGFFYIFYNYLESFYLENISYRRLYYFFKLGFLFLFGFFMHFYFLRIANYFTKVEKKKLTPIKIAKLIFK